MRKKIILLAVLVVLIVIVISFLPRFLRPHPQSARIVNDQPVVTLTPISTHRLPQKIRAYATTISPQSAAVATKLAGTIGALNFTAGQEVKKGQLLFSIRSNDIDHQAQQLKSDMLYKQTHYQRYLQANRQTPGLIAKDDLQKARSDAEQAKAAYAAALSATQILAPIDGRISATNLTVGSAVSEGENLVNIITSRALQISYQLPSQYMSHVKLGQSVRFAPEHSQTSFQGQVSYIAPQLSASDNMLNLRASLQQSQSLQPNLFGRVTQILNANYRTLVIPQSLVQSDAQGFYVYVVQLGKVSAHYFQPGDTTAQGYVEVKSGISPGTKLITSDISSLTVGQKVKVGQP